jgi:hypothetical protein
MWAIPYCSQRQFCWRASVQTDRESQSPKCIFNPSPPTESREEADLKRAEDTHVCLSPNGRLVRIA